MQENSAGPDTHADSDTRRTLKRVARRLFAERGIRDVSVREIAVEAGQRNMGAVAYHFGTKDALISEVLIEGAMRIEARRHQFLDRLEAQGRPLTAGDAVAAIVIPCVEFADGDEEYGRFFNRFLMRLSLYQPDFIDRTLAGRYNAGYQRCLAHLRRLMADLPVDVQSRRFIFLGSYLSTLLAQREAIIADTRSEHRTWRSDQTVADLIQTAAALLQAPLPH